VERVVGECPAGLQESHRFLDRAISQAAGKRNEGGTQTYLDSSGEPGMAAVADAAGLRAVSSISFDVDAMVAIAGFQRQKCSRIFDEVSAYAPAN